MYDTWDTSSSLLFGPRSVIEMSLILRHSPIHTLRKESKERPIEWMFGPSDHQQILLAHRVAGQLGQFG